MNHRKWSGIFGLLITAIFAIQPGIAATDYVVISVNGDTSATSAFQGDAIGWSADCAIGSAIQWEIYLDIDSNNSIDIGSDKLLYNFTTVDGDISGNNGPGDSDPNPDGMIVVSPLILGFAPGYYMMSGTDTSDGVGAEDWFAMNALLSPPNMFTGHVTVPGYPAPDAFLKNIWIAAESQGAGMQMWTGLTDDNGYFEINIGSAGTGFPFRISPENLPGIVTPAPRNLTANGQIDNVDFDYMLPYDSVYGFVEDNEGNSIENGYVWARPRFSGPGEKETSINSGRYAIYFGDAELGEWEIGVGTEGLIPDYMASQNFTINNSIDHEIQLDFTCYLTDTVIYVRVTEMGAEPVHPYLIQSQSALLHCFTEGVSGIGSNNLIALRVSSLDPDGYGIQLAFWSDQYPIPEGYIIEGGYIYNVAPGDTVTINLVTGIKVQDTIQVAPTDPIPDWNQVFVNFWTPGKSYNATPDNNGIFTAYVESGTYDIAVYAPRYLSLPVMKTIHVTADTVGGLGLLLNYAHCHFGGHLTGVPLPLDSGLMVSAQTADWPDGYHTSGAVDPVTGAYDIYVCDGSWSINPPFIPGYSAPSPINSVLSNDDCLFDHDFEYATTDLSGDRTAVLPSAIDLSQNSPNPFNPATSITFALPVRSQVDLKVYNILGQEIKTLVNGEFAAGVHSVVWDGTDQSGHAAATGIYFYRLTAGEKTMIKKMILLK
ncbi:MAG: T9SS type A sorting domain-containing protein [candidate division Zixibacteria bacterium]|nr:T9SS type A sorting domain-containing protein [candidate division Zixibacteria bacterium]